MGSNKEKRRPQRERAAFEGEGVMEQRERLVEKSRRPTAESVAAFLGAEAAGRWSRLLDYIESTYPGGFEGEWLFGGARHGWSLRFKKSRSFCTLVPERDCLKVLLVFGAAEREKVAGVLDTLVSHARADYLEAHTYHDGKWVVIEVDGEDDLGEDLVPEADLQGFEVHEVLDEPRVQESVGGAKLAQLRHFRKRGDVPRRHVIQDQLCELGKL